ncbi:B-cell antigen receptor complex-associated protein beta chain-like isoform X1 [Acipenser oxyrinchus oxyrinchus]|uniref:B-cell antigen receptor complex-associated protein beta chain-like isoform X1 n=1 Tax=Acipenser oxyrinchus oxyrinchus TaxID=40147 RepID=A0AAD8D0X8_ACIOX|nr:B-cell antigen receptor complex-associated protein beta chain-like isoform X1 [Acipenser oxyrinchus oxyrinchus]
MAFSVFLRGCLFLGCFVFQVANLSTGFNVVQSPRFLGIKTGATVCLSCMTDSPDAVEVKWWKRLENGDQLYWNESASAANDSYSNSRKFIFNIRKIKSIHSGIYYCNIQINNVIKNGSGTELKVHARTETEEIASKNTMKDAIILIQGFLLLAFCCAPFLLSLSKDDAESDNGELEEEHTYEGLEIGQNENTAQYEDIVSVRGNGEARWMYGEHPCQE